MKKINYKNLILTSLLCVLPMLLGVSFYNNLPEQMAFHFAINNQPNSFASKDFIVFGFPIIMLILHILLCVLSDMTSTDRFKITKLFKILKWVIPITTITIYIAIISYSLDNDIEMRKYACFIGGTLFALLGNYFTKIPFSVAKGNFYPPSLTDDETIWKKVSKAIGISMLVLAALLVVSIFLPEICSIIVVILILPLTLSIFVYSCKLISKKRNSARNN